MKPADTSHKADRKKAQEGAQEAQDGTDSGHVKSITVDANTDPKAAGGMGGNGRCSEGHDEGHRCRASCL